MGDGKMRSMVATDIRVGHVVRRTSDDGDVAPFEDSIIARVGLDEVELVRPHVCVREPDGRNERAVDLRMERYTVQFGGLIKYFKVLLSDRGEPMIFKYGP